MTYPTSQCDPTGIRQYLAGELAAQAEAEIVQHLDDCPHCQHQIEALAASAEEWNEARSLLAPDGAS
ncbi:MAG: zf-HC2 domain-containing protein, partial [Pirellulaceae bacterium]